MDTIVNYISPKAEVHPSSKVWRFSQVLDGAKIGKNCVIGANCSIDRNVIIEDNVRIQNGCNLFDGVILRCESFIGPGVTFTNVVNPRSIVERKVEYKWTIVGRGASIGAGVTIVCGVVIGEYALVGAGSVVTGSVLPYHIYYGNPARPRGYICKCGDQMHKEDRFIHKPKVVTCPKCEDWK